MPHHMKMETPQDLFLHELSDMLSAEHIIVQMLGEAQGMVQDPQVRQGLQQHQEETRRHIVNLDQVFQQLGTEPHQVECHAVKGMQQELMDVEHTNPSPEVMQGIIVGAAGKTEHYEIAAYTDLVKQARAMGQTRIADLLQHNLQQEQAMLQRIEDITDRLTQQMAGQMDMPVAQQDFASPM